MKFKNIQDLADYMDTSPEESCMSRRIYKETSCGAWLSILPPRPIKRSGKWIAKLTKTIAGVAVHSIRPYKGKRILIDDPEMPQEVLDYFCVPRGKNRMVLVDDPHKNPEECWRLFDELYEKLSSNHKKQMVNAGNPMYVESDEICYSTSRTDSGGIAVGSIVEGVDQCTLVYELRFPFTEKDLDRVVQSVEDEAQEIWDETHGCEKCGPTNEFGHTPVDPDCPACKGSGCII